MPYNILLIANDVYFKLLAVCLKSLLSVCDLSKIKKIFIANLGLNDENLSCLQNLNAKIEIINAGTIASGSAAVHSKDWVDAVSQKTRILHKLVQDDNIPVIMMDSDMIIIEDFSGVINNNFDIQICRRSKPLIRPDGLVVNHIASFFVINNKGGLSFITDWINRMHERIDLNMIPPHETPAMVEVLSKEENISKFGFIDDKIVSCENSYIPGTTKIVHAKGRTAKDKISIFRFSNIKNLPYSKTIYLFNGTEKITFTLSFALKKIVNGYEIKNKLRQIKKRISKKDK
ncbi:hypothetical protein FACS189491_06470 [Spirochaetia bacterium]|nr:hypothetical protein FACS189491_06470 [Spirochaetia bacterium]